MNKNKNFCFNYYNILINPYFVPRVIPVKEGKIISGESGAKLMLIGLVGSGQNQQGEEKIRVSHHDRRE
jgi:hypothetical protein